MSKSKPLHDGLAPAWVPAPPNSTRRAVLLLRGVTSHDYTVASQKEVRDFFNLQGPRFPVILVLKYESNN